MVYFRYMFSVRKSLIYFLVFVVIGAFVVYKIVDTAWDGTYDYDKEYGYAVGNTDEYTPDPVQ